MHFILKFSICLLCLVVNASAQVNWNGDWAMQCDFPGNDIANARSNGEDCSFVCLANQNCNHYSWNSFNGGTCWLKRGNVNKNNAVRTNDPGSVCGVISSRLTQQPGGDTVPFSLINRCSYPIWIGVEGRSRSNPGWQLPNRGGWLLNAGQTTNHDMPRDLNAARFWGRTNCRTENGRFICDTGDCGPWIECAHDGIQRGGETPATLAEFTLNSNNQDYYDLSLVDGYNLQMTIRPKSPNRDQAGQYWCGSPECLSDLNRTCPEELKKKNKNGQVVGCYSACEKYRTDQYCCKNQFDTPQTCTPSIWPVNYPSVFKQACPMAYSYAYDDPLSTFFCRNTGYDIIFC